LNSARMLFDHSPISSPLLVNEFCLLTKPCDFVVGKYFEINESFA